MIASTIPLRAVLVLSGAFILFTALDVALGGIATMGWQVSGDFFRPTDEATFVVQDSHTRFLGGVWAGVGLVFLGGAYDLRRFGPALLAVLPLIVIGGLARTTQLRPDVLLGPDIAGSLLAELVGAPLLWLWVARARRASARTNGTPPVPVRAERPHR